MDEIQKIRIAFELHAVKDIRSCFENGINPNMQVNGKPLVFELINMYSRGPIFKECMQVFVDYGLSFEDEMLLAVLLDDASSVDRILVTNKEWIHKTYDLDCTFTPLFQASLLHICAEYGHLACAEVLIKHGADINAKAGIDAFGFGGHTPIFHIVNQHQNFNIKMLHLLLDHKADLNLTVKGLIWGKGYEWETFIPAVNPMSYAMMGLLRQFQRTEKDIYEVVDLLMKALFGIQYSYPNVPNKYLLH